MTSTAKSSSSPLASIFGSTPEEDAKLAQLREAQERLQSALMDRKPMFDPMLLAMAQGFLAPNPSGNFFNALGNVAGKVGQAQEVEEKRQLERMQLQNELLKSQYDQMAQAREAQDIAGILGGSKPVSGLQVPSLSAEAEQSRAPSPATSTTSSGVGSRLSEISDSDLVRLNLMRDPRGKQLANLIMAIRKGEREDMLVLPDGTLINVRRPEEVIRQGYGGTASETYVPELGGTVQMIPYERQRYEQLKQQALEQGWYNSFAEQYKNYRGDLNRIKNPNIPQNASITAEERSAGSVPFGSTVQIGAPLAPRVDAGIGTGQSGSAEPLSGGAAQLAGIGGGGRTKEEQARSQEVFKTNEAIRQAAGIERAKAETALEESIFAGGRIAPDLIRNADVLIDLASNPKTKGTFGILAQSGFLGALGQLGENSLRIGSYNIGIPSIETAIRTSTKTPAEIRAAELAGAASTTLELNFRQLFYKGQGSVSNMEGEVISRLAGNIKETPEGIVAKAQMVKLRSEFDRKTAEIFRAAQKRGISVRDFKDENEYKTAVKEYDDGIQGVLRSIINFPPSGGARPNRPGPPAGGSPNLAPAPALGQRQPAAVSPDALPPGFSIPR